MRKIILVSITTLIFIGCNQKLNEKCDSIVKENAQIEKMQLLGFPSTI